MKIEISWWVVVESNPRFSFNLGSELSPYCQNCKIWVLKLGKAIVKRVI
jgi:hypothetical protein